MIETTWHLQDVILIVIAWTPISRASRATERSSLSRTHREYPYKGHPAGRYLRAYYKKWLHSLSVDAFFPWALTWAWRRRTTVPPPSSPPRHRRQAFQYWPAAMEQTDASSGRNTRPPFLNGGQLKTRKQEGKAYIPGPCWEKPKI